MLRRLLSHAVVVALLVLSALQIDPISDVAAASEPSLAPTLLEVAPMEVNQLPRGGAGRDLMYPFVVPTPTPLPTPVYVDPNVDPLPGPTAVTPTIQSVSTLTLQSQPLIWPTAGTLTTPFSSAHPAVDIAASCGTPVLAPMSGTISYAGWRNNGGGYVLEISGWAVTSLNHLGGFALTSGYVEAGTVVGYVGMTGLSSGCHVHWNLIVDGAWHNPLAYIGG